MYNWKTHDTGGYFYNENTGKVIGVTIKIANQSILYTAKVYTGDTTYTVEDEKHLGQYISSDSAQKAVERYWAVFDKTLLA